MRWSAGEERAVQDDKSSEDQRVCSHDSAKQRRRRSISPLYHPGCGGTGDLHRCHDTRPLRRPQFAPALTGVLSRILCASLALSMAITSALWELSQVMGKGSHTSARCFTRPHTTPTHLELCRDGTDLSWGPCGTASRGQSMTACLRAEIVLQWRCFSLHVIPYRSRDMRRGAAHVYDRLLPTYSVQHCTVVRHCRVLSVDHSVQSKDGPKSGFGRLNCAVYLAEIQGGVPYLRDVPMVWLVYFSFSFVWVCVDMCVPAPTVLWQEAVWTA